MKSRDYWRQRLESLEKAQNQIGQQCYGEIEQQFRQAQKSLEAEISMWYGRFAKGNSISMQEARRLLSTRELEEFRWDVQEYIRMGKANARTDGQWMLQLENASARYHISRLESLKIHTQQCMERLFGNQLDSLDTAMRKAYTEGYYHTAYEIQKGIGVGWDFATLDERKINKVIGKPWAADGKDFSERIWQNKKKLTQELNTTLTQNIILGQDPQKAIDKMSKRLGVSKSSAGRLVMTEQAFFSSAAQRDCFRELDVEQFEIVATLDSITSEICRNMDGRHFPMSQWEVGVTAPPFHVNCRTFYCPYFDDEFDAIGKRAARDENGKVYYVPIDTTYNEWKKAFVGGDKSDLQEASSDSKSNFRDITDKWTRSKGIKGSVVEKQEYTIDGTTYKVDGRHVILRPTAIERDIAVVLSEKYGKTVELVPQVVFPQGVQTPDYLIDGKRFDLKSPIGRGKNLLYGMIAKKKEQSRNFIIDITNCPLSMEELEGQAERLYGSWRVSFLEKLVFMRNGEIVKVLSRK